MITWINRPIANASILKPSSKHHLYTNSVCDYCEVVSKSNDCSPRYDFKTASDGENNTTDLIEDARLDLTDALLQIKARLLQCTLGTLGDRTGRGVLLVRKCTLSVLYFQVHDDWQECHSQNCHDNGNDVNGSTDRTYLFLRLLVNCIRCRT